MLDSNLDRALDGTRRDHRLGDVILCALVHCGDRYCFVALAGQHHHRNVGVPGVDSLQHLDSIVLGKRIVQQHAIGRAFL